MSEIVILPGVAQRFETSEGIFNKIPGIIQQFSHNGETYTIIPGFVQVMNIGFSEQEEILRTIINTWRNLGDNYSVDGNIITWDNWIRMEVNIDGTISVTSVNGRHSMDFSTFEDLRNYYDI